MDEDKKQPQLIIVVEEHPIILKLILILWVCWNIYYIVTNQWFMLFLGIFSFGVGVMISRLTR